MELTNYRKEFIAKVQEKAFDDELMDQEAFFQIACDMLRDSEAISDYQPIEPGYRFGRGTSRFMAIDGYDQSAFEMDESIVVIACDDNYSIRVDEEAPTIQAKECILYINAMRRFIVSAWQGRFLEQGEESGTAYEFASFIHENKNNISRFRLYFVTDREYTGRDSSIKDPTDFYSTDDDGHKISLEAHVWDIRHLMEAAETAAPLEHLTVNLGDEGIAAVKAPNAENDMETYLLFLSGQTLASWYKKHGSKLMEANVRSFLSLRGKVNRGIRATLGKEPDRFVAYNNGLSATASSVHLSERGCITSIEDLQIVNGGQTTASIFYSQQKDRLDLSKVVVPVKLVVVHEDIARELVPNISRYTNSQNKVAETDFSSNSEYQVKLAQLSQHILTPPLPGKNPTHWYYERTRGQYESEKNRRDTTERKQFERLNPSKQRIKMIDAPKYLMCWDGHPETVSLGSQKCFAQFVASEAKKGKESVEALDTNFFKQLVCKRIVFDTVYKHIKSEAWYKGAYQANIAEYAVAKYAFDMKRVGSEFEFEAVWRAQCIQDPVLCALLKAAEQSSDVLNNAQRPIQNVSEWAKKKACWDNLQRLSSCLDAQPVTSMIAETFMPRIDAEKGLRHAMLKSSDEEDDKDVRLTWASTNELHFQNQTESEISKKTYVTDWTSVPPTACRSLYDYANNHSLLSPKAKESLESLIVGNTTDININALNYLVQIAIKNGFQYSVLYKGDPFVGKSHLAIESPRRVTDNDMNYRRDFLMAIPSDTWKTIIDWANYHKILTDNELGIIAKLEKPIRLTNDQTRQLWELRDKMLDRGFSGNQFAPRPSRH